MSGTKYAGRDTWLASFAVVSLTHSATFGALVSKLEFSGVQNGWLAISILLAGSTILILVANNFDFLVKFGFKLAPEVMLLPVILFAGGVIWISLQMMGVKQSGGVVEMLIATLVSWFIWSKILAMFSNLLQNKTSESSND